MKKKILLLEGVHPDTVGLLENNSFEVERTLDCLPDEELIEKIKDISFIGIRSRTQLTKKILDAAPKLEAIFCFCIGTNQVDTAYAEQLGIPVFNSPFSNTRSVAELVLAIIVFLMRGIPQKNMAAHKGEWQKSAKNAYEVRRKKLGIIGYGNIGAQLSVLASGMGIHVYYYDIANKLPIGNSAKLDSLNELLEKSDIVSLHVPETEETKNMMNRETFAKMKDGSYLINHSRGHVVDIDALMANLDSGKILGAALDVFPVEPTGIEEEFISPLRKYDNVILTPHIGGSTVEAQEKIGIDSVENITKFSHFGSTEGAVNFPEVSLPMVKENMSRIIHIHENMPGIMQKVNQVIYSHDMNVQVQWLQTNSNIGYAVLDLQKIENPEQVLQELNEIDGTISSRII